MRRPPVEYHGIAHRLDDDRLRVIDGWFPPGGPTTGNCRDGGCSKFLAAPCAHFPEFHAKVPPGGPTTGY